MAHAMLTGQFLHALETYHVALTAWALAERSGEPEVLVKHLADWRDRQRAILNRVLDEVAAVIARQNATVVPEGWDLEIIDPDNPQVLKGPFEIKIVKSAARSGRALAHLKDEVGQPLCRKSPKKV